MHRHTQHIAYHIAYEWHMSHLVQNVTLFTSQQVLLIDLHVWMPMLPGTCVCMHSGCMPDVFLLCHVHYLSPGLICMYQQIPNYAPHLTTCTVYKAEPFKLSHLGMVVCIAVSLERMWVSIYGRKTMMASVQPHIQKNIHSLYLLACMLLVVFRAWFAFIFIISLGGSQLSVFLLLFLAQLWYSVCMPHHKCVLYIIVKVGYPVLL